MLTEDQMSVSYVQDAKVVVHNNGWHIEGGQEVNSVHLFIDSEHKRIWEEDQEVRRGALRKDIANFTPRNFTPREPSLEEIIRDSALKEANTVEDIHAYLKSLLGRMMDRDWAGMLDARAKTLEMHLKREIACSICNETFPCTSLYSVDNHLPVKWDAYDRPRRYCGSCLHEVYELLFPVCLLCDCRHEVNTLNDDRELCQKCRTKVNLKERTRVRNHLERAKSCGAVMSLTLKQWLATLDHFEWTCAYCRGPYHALEHYNPLPLGGTSANNCVPSCTPCNMRKRDRSPDQIDGLFPTENLMRIREWLGA